MTSYSPGSPVQRVEEEFSEHYPTQLDGLDVEEEVRHTWEIRNYKALPTRTLSDVFYAGGRPWRILLFPEGNGQSGSRGQVSLFLKLLHDDEVAETSGDSTDENDPAPNSAKGNTAKTAARALNVDDSAAPTRQKPSKVFKEDTSQEDLVSIHVGQHGGRTSAATSDGGICVQFLLIMWNPDHPEAHFTQKVEKRYNASVQDWGYAQFHDLRSALAPGTRGHAIIDNNRVNITAIVRVISDTTGILWRENFSDYDSKKSTGYIGLMNQGATCYLNSLIQSLFFTSVFRQTVYMIPDSENTLAGNLQRLFYQLSTSDITVDTSGLTRSFGWDSADAFTQHDVQELNRILMDKLENTMKNTPYEKALSKMFVGQMKSFIKCLNIDFESARVEDFWDIQLNVRGCKDVYESFEKYVEPELLAGENQYHATDFGLQDAKKGVIFEYFPPVLHLQLKRYDYDYMRDLEIKINDRYEFPMELDLANYVDPASEANEAKEPWVYELHGVLVHSGDLNSGHYYALIKPDARGSWYRFDDDYVTPATPREVLEENYGGQSGASGMPHGLQRVTSAYMLVYIRKSRIDYVLPSGADQVPARIPASLQNEELREEKLRQEIEDKERHMDIGVLSNNQFKHNTSVGLAPWSSQAKTPASAGIVRFRRDRTVKELMKLIEGLDQVFLPPKPVTLWLVSTHEYSTRRLVLIPNDRLDEPAHILAMSTGGMTPCVWVETAEGDVDTKLLVFVKEFDAKAQSLRGLGTRWIRTDATWHAIFGDTTAYKEFKGTVEPLPADATVASSGVDFGSIIVLAKDDSPVTNKEKAGSALLRIKDYYKLLQHMVSLSVIAKASCDSVDIDGRDIEDLEGVAHVSATTLDTYPKLVSRIGEALGIDPGYLALYVSGYNGTLQQLKSDGSNLKELFPRPLTAPGAHANVLYEVLEKPLVEFEENCPVSLLWFSDQMTHGKLVSLVLHRSQTLQAIVEALVANGDISADAAQYVKFWTSDSLRELHELLHSTHVSELGSTGEVFGSLMTDEEWNVRANQLAGRIVTVFRFYKTPSSCHTVPFSFAILKDEPWSQTKERLKKRLGYSEKVFENIPIAVCQYDAKYEPLYIDSDEQILFDHMREEDLLGLDHVDKSRTSLGRAAMVIK